MCIIVLLKLVSLYLNLNYIFDYILLPINNNKSCVLMRFKFNKLYTFIIRFTPPHKVNLLYKFKFFFYRICGNDLLMFRLVCKNFFVERSIRIKRQNANLTFFQLIISRWPWELYPYKMFVARYSIWHIQIELRLGPWFINKNHYFGLTINET